MNIGYQAVLVSCLAAGAGAAAYWYRSRMPLNEFTRYALYMAVLDDEICRNELEGNQIGDKVIRFPSKEETLQERYHLFLQMNRNKGRRQLQKQIAAMERRLERSRQYIGQPKERLEVEWLRKRD